MSRGRLLRHTTSRYGDPSDEEYDSELDGSFDFDNDDNASNSGSDVTSYRSSESDLPNEAVEDNGWVHVNPVDASLPDTRHSADIPFIEEPAGLRPGTDGQRPAFASPMDCFKALIDNSVIKHLVDSTNDRAREYLGSNPNRKVNGIKWVNVTEGVMYIFLAFCMIMGIVKLPKISDYWSHDPVFGGPPIFVGRVMSRNKFQNIMKFLRFTRSEEVRDYHKPSHIESFLKLLRQKCKELIFVGLHIAIDESLIAWKGRLLFKQFIKTKRSRYGIKVFFLCPGAPDWQGFSYDFEVYYGKDSSMHEIEAGQTLSKSEQVVLQLMMDLLHAGRHVITDNWYTSVRLANELLRCRTF